MGKAEYVVPLNDNHAIVAVSALVHAMAETNSVAIVRWVKRKKGAPILGVLTPAIKVVCIRSKATLGKKGGLEGGTCRRNGHTILDPYGGRKGGRGEGKEKGDGGGQEKPLQRF
jgi:hypothetical protein